jgi:hypothetical protein
VSCAFFAVLYSVKIARKNFLAVLCCDVIESLEGEAGISLESLDQKTRVFLV